VQQDQRNVQKKVDARAKLLFFLFKLNAFCRSRCRRRRRCLSSLLNIYEMRCFTVLQVYYTLYIKKNNLPDGQREQDNQTEIEPL